MCFVCIRVCSCASVCGCALCVCVCVCACVCACGCVCVCVCVCVVWCALHYPGDCEALHLALKLAQTAFAWIHFPVTSLGNNSHSLYLYLCYFVELVQNCCCLFRCNNWYPKICVHDRLTVLAAFIDEIFCCFPSVLWHCRLSEGHWVYTNRVKTQRQVHLENGHLQAVVVVIVVCCHSLSALVFKNSALECAFETWRYCLAVNFNVTFHCWL